MSLIWTHTPHSSRQSNFTNVLYETFTNISTLCRIPRMTDPVTGKSSLPRTTWFYMCTWMKTNKKGMRSRVSCLSWNNVAHNSKQHLAILIEGERWHSGSCDQSAVTPQCRHVSARGSQLWRHGGATRVLSHTCAYKVPWKVIPSTQNEAIVSVWTLFLHNCVKLHLEHSTYMKVL